jgi:TatD DNase family protein
MIDTHCHLQYPGLAENVDVVLATASQAGVEKIVVPGTNLQSSKEAIQLSQRYPQVFAAVGSHPVHEEGEEQETFEAFEELLISTPQKVVAIGEVGMDYYHLPSSNSEALKAKKQQVEKLQFFIKLAKQYNLPLIIHSRDCFEDLYQLLKESAANHPTVIHCFVGSKREAKAWLDLGYHLSFTNILTYSKNADLREVAAWLPVGTFMLETDAPFLAPRNKRGVCEPVDVVNVADCLAIARGKTLAEIAAETNQTAERFFGFAKYSQ